MQISDEQVPEYLLFLKIQQYIRDLENGTKPDVESRLKPDEVVSEFSRRYDANDLLLSVFQVMSEVFSEDQRAAILADAVERTQPILVPWPEAIHENAPSEDQSIEARDDNTETADRTAKRGRHGAV